LRRNHFIRIASGSFSFYSFYSYGKKSLTHPRPDPLVKSAAKVRNGRQKAKVQRVPIRFLEYLKQLNEMKGKV
ncbi:MAG: hypothetical protein M3040_02940, partial [Bacteroidota bacterium]|nr:hypothetical protein [Bacteroidota bacterium]